MAIDPTGSLAEVLESIDELGHDYVLYRERDEQERLVLIVEGLDDVHELEDALERSGAKARTSDVGHDFLLTSTNKEGVQRAVVIELKMSDGKNGVANMLWRAASQESAIAARRTIAEK